MARSDTGDVIRLATVRLSRPASPDRVRLRQSGPRGRRSAPMVDEPYRRVASQQPDLETRRTRFLRARLLRCESIWTASKPGQLFSVRPRPARVRLRE